MLCLFRIPPTADEMRAELPRQIEAGRDTKLTALALAAIALVVLAVSCFLWGYGTAPGTMLTGVNFFPYLLGSVLCVVGAAVAVGAGVFALKLGYHAIQIHRLNKALGRIVD